MATASSEAPAQTPAGKELLAASEEGAAEVKSAPREREDAAAQSGSSVAARFAFVGGGKIGRPNDSSPSVTRKGILTLRLSGTGPEASWVDTLDVGGAVKWIEVHPFNGCLYACWDGRLGAFRISPDGTLKHLSSEDTCGDAAHLCIAPNGAWILTAGYMNRLLLVFRIAADGSLCPAWDSKLHEAPLLPELADRQEQCHPHQVRTLGCWALSCDLGADLVWVYGFDGSGGLVGALSSDRHLQLPRGSGPRHLDFHPNGKLVYVLCELDGNVVTCEWDAKDGRLTAKSSVYLLLPRMSTCRAHHAGASAIRAAPDGRKVYASHRTNNSIVVLGVDDAACGLQRLQIVSCGGATPRDLVLDWSPAGRYIRVGNQDSQRVVTFAVDEDGLLVEEPASVLETTGCCPTCITEPVVL